MASCCSISTCFLFACAATSRISCSCFSNSASFLEGRPPLLPLLAGTTGGSCRCSSPTTMASSPPSSPSLSSSSSSSSFTAIAYKEDKSSISMSIHYNSTYLSLRRKLGLTSQSLLLCFRLLSWGGVAIILAELQSLFPGSLSCTRTTQA